MMIHETKIKKLIHVINNLSHLKFNMDMYSKEGIEFLIDLAKKDLDEIKGMD